MKTKLLPAIVATIAMPLISKAEDRPNIIFLMTDDQSFNSIAALGATHDVKTPNLDRMVESGVAFTRHYATTSISMASRAITMTGMYEYKTGCNFDHGPLAPEKFERSYPVLLREAGYFTGFAGKFGFALSDIEYSSNHHSYDLLPVDKFDMWGGGLGQTYYETEKNEYMAKYADKYPHSSLSYGAFGCDFIDAAQESGKPFCLSISFKAPHSPLTPDPRFDDVYAQTHFDIPESAKIDDLLPTQAKLGRQYLCIDMGVDEETYQKWMKPYHQLIHGVDAAIGMLLEKLEQTGLDKNTIIIFTSDNGYSLGDRRLGGKVLAYEPSSHIPLIILDPRQKKSSGKRATIVSGNIDIAPTILDYAGVAIPDNMDGGSLVKAVKSPQKAKVVHDDLALINAWGTAGCYTLAVVEGRFKYIYWGYGEQVTPHEELFDIESDPMELNNLASNSRYAKDLKRLRGLYDQRIETWKREAVLRNNYTNFSTIYDRNLSWDERRDAIPNSGWNSYKQIVRDILDVGEDIDLYDYDTIVDYKVYLEAMYQKANKK